MTREEIIEDLLNIYSELAMGIAEYTAYVNENHSNEADKITQDMALAYRTGSVQAQIENIIARLTIL